MAKARILLVDDDTDMLATLSKLLTRKQYHVDVAENGVVALAKMDGNAYDVVISDVRMPEMNGIELLEAVKHRNPQTEVILLTGYGTIETAVDAMKKGAWDYITKPPNPDEILVKLTQIRERQQLSTINEALAQELSANSGYGGIIGEHATMINLYDMIERVAESDSTVLIRGESGVGKELVARAIHLKSARAKRPFIVVNCAALSGELLENELFGHEKGAFTDARERRIGKFEVAHRGTIFLDEVGATNSGLQQSLLRVLQEKAFERVGGTESIEVDARVLAATNAPLEKMVQDHDFREDLYYRINVVRLDIPPLRERRSDIPLLAQHFFGKYAGKTSRKVKGVSPQALACLQNHHWPGNVRELENAIERAIILGRSELIEPVDLPVEVQQARAVTAPREHPLSLAEQLERTERQVLLDALNRNEWNQSKTAEALQINRTTLIGKMKKYGLVSSED